MWEGKEGSADDLFSPFEAGIMHDVHFAHCWLHNVGFPNRQTCRNNNIGYGMSGDWWSLKGNGQGFKLFGAVEELSNEALCSRLFRPNHHDPFQPVPLDFQQL